jgi:hypothetical protein
MRVPREDDSKQAEALEEQAMAAGQFVEAATLSRQAIRSGGERDVGRALHPLLAQTGATRRANGGRFRTATGGAMAVAPVAEARVCLGRLRRLSQDRRQVRDALRIVRPLTIVWPAESDCRRALGDFESLHLSHGTASSTR